MEGLIFGILRYYSRKKLLLFRLTLETFRFEDDDDKRNEVEI